jgi:hypothetical protein
LKKNIKRKNECVSNLSNQTKHKHTKQNSKMQPGIKISAKSVNSQTLLGFNKQKMMKNKLEISKCKPQLSSLRIGAESLEEEERERLTGMEN